MCQMCRDSLVREYQDVPRLQAGPAGTAGAAHREGPSARPSDRRAGTRSAQRSAATAARMSSIPCSIRSMWVRNESTQMRKMKVPLTVVPVR